jgi:hypothetical protein
MDTLWEGIVDVRLIQLLGSFIGARSDYALARLEFSMKYAQLAAPPTIDRLSEASERALRVEWPGIEEQLEAAIEYVKRLERNEGMTQRDDRARRAFERSIRELDQYARAIRWVLTVTQSEER